MTLGADLYHLQRLDSKGDSTQGRLTEIAAALGESQQLIQARQTLEDGRVLVRKWATQQRGLELEIQGLADKATIMRFALLQGQPRLRYGHPRHNVTISNALKQPSPPCET